MTDTELKEQIAAQSEMIGKLTDALSMVFLQKGAALSDLNALYCDKGGGENKVKIGESQITVSNQPKMEELENVKKKKEIDIEKLKKKIDIANVRARQDGRYEWQKMIAGETHREIDADYEELRVKVREHKKLIKELAKSKPKKYFQFVQVPAVTVAPVVEEKKLMPTLYTACYDYLHRYKKHLPSFESYEGILRKHLKKLTKPIDEYTKDDIYDFLHKDIKKSRKLCFQTLKNVFAEAAENGTIPRNIIATLKRPVVEKIEGRWFTTSEQKLILDNIKSSGMEDEIMFYLMTGCRLSEAFKAKPDFDKCSVYVTRTKRDGTSGYVKISKEYSETLRTKWHLMFKELVPDQYSRRFTAYLKKLEIKFPDTSLHSLRHTFCTNLYYLGVPSKARQYLMGHKTSAMTNDLYTTYDPNITKQDIVNLYGELYPDFENAKDMRIAS